MSRILFGIDDNFDEMILHEDGPVENATAIAYFASFIFSDFADGYRRSGK